MKIIFTSTILLGLISCNNKSNQEHQNPNLNEIKYEQFYLKDNNLKISYPKDWDATKLDSRTILTVTENDTSKKDLFKENIVLYKVQMPSKFPLDSVLNLAKSALEEKYQKLKILKSEIVKNEMKKDFAILKCILPKKGIDVVTSTFYFPSKNDFYILDVSYNSKDSSKFIPIFEKVINSFTFDK